MLTSLSAAHYIRTEIFSLSFSFPNPPARRKLLTLYCAVVGEVGSAFPVDIDASLSVGHLKDAIKNKNLDDPTLRNVAPKNLQLFLAKKDKGHGAWVTEEEAMRGVDDTTDLKLLKSARAAIGDVGLSEDEVRIQVSKEEVEDLKGPVHVLVVVPTEVAVAPPRKRVKMLPEEVKPPSLFANRRVWSAFLMEDGRIICDRVDRPENIEITGEDVTFAENVANAMQQYYSFEAHRATEFRQLLESYLGIPIICKNNEKYKDDGSIISGMRGLLCMNLEVKLERGLGDAGMQNIAFYIHQSKFARYSEKYEIPALLVELEGPWLGVSAVLNINGSIVHEHLSPQLPLAAPNHLRKTVLLYLASLKRAIPASCLPIGCTPNYVRIMREVYANGHGKIIKFVEGRYGDTVHRFCASKGNAPPLLSCELVSPNGIWWRVEMEEWELKSITEATNPDDVQSQLKLLLDELRENNFVHGDLRPPNVFLHGSQEQVVLIDFDWAGVAGVDIYPIGMNPEINWPKGAHGGAKLDPAHDLEWLYRMFPSESKC
ncbi:putative protein kinase-like domain superfamily [Plasmopara halstedii]